MTNFQITKRNEVAHWEEIPFAYEHAMSGYILENPQILKLNDSSLSNVSILGSEVQIKGSRKRADITVSFSDGNNNAEFGIIELKNHQAKKPELMQLQNYLNLSAKSNLNYSIGVLVAPDFDFAILNEIKKSDNIYGVKITRYESDNEFIVVADVIYPEKQKKNYTRYNLTNLQKCTIENLSKTRLVWHIVNSYVKNNNNNSLDFNKLKTEFPDSLQNRLNTSTIHLIEKKDDVPEHLRGRYSKESITLNYDGSEILVSNQWSVGNIEEVIKKASSLGMIIKNQN